MGDTHAKYVAMVGCIMLRHALKSGAVHCCLPYMYRLNTPRSAFQAEEKYKETSSRDTVSS